MFFATESTRPMMKARPEGPEYKAGEQNHQKTCDCDGPSRLDGNFMPYAAFPDDKRVWSFPIVCPFRRRGILHNAVVFPTKPERPIMLDSTMHRYHYIIMGAGRQRCLRSPLHPNSDSDTATNENEPDPASQSARGNFGCCRFSHGCDSILVCWLVSL